MKFSITKNAKILTLFALACTLIVATVNALTKGVIAEQEQQQLIKTLHTVIAEDRMDNDMFNDCVSVYQPMLGSITPQTAYLSRKNGKPVAAAITAIAPDGYNGDIQLLIAINYDGSISGVRALKHQETPGLGDKIERRKSNWVDSFVNKRITDEKDSRWHVAKDGGMFDQFTGATITPRAVVKATKKTLLYFNQHKDELFNASTNCHGVER